MSDSALTQHIEDNQEPSPREKFRDVIADAFTFVRSAEANRAMATVTLEQLMVDQIARNGESARSNASQYNPYSYEPGKVEEASKSPAKRANFLGGTDTGMPTKLDRVLAITNTMKAAIAEIKALTPAEVASPEDIADQATVAAPEE